jgi:hypothetical protein
MEGAIEILPVGIKPGSDFGFFFWGELALVVGHCGPTINRPRCYVETLEALSDARIGAGDEGAWAFQHFCVRHDASVDAGVEKLINNDGSSERTLLRALALRRYAEQPAS